MAQDTRKTNATGQLRPLEDRMSKGQRVRREDRKEFRRSVAQQAGITRGIALATLSVVNRGFFGRLKWLLVGR
jgi:hypothetical protein